MNISIFRILSIGVLAWILFTKSYMLVTYWFVFIALVELLNLKEAYRKKQYKTLNTVFFAYLLFITLVRTIPYKTSAFNRYIINSIEHLLFSLIICLIIFLIIEIINLYAHRTALLRIVVTAIIFYAVGIANEVYQNIAVNKPAFIFDKGSRIDLLVNFFGVIIFVFLSRKVIQVRVKKVA